MNSQHRGKFARLFFDLASHQFLKAWALSITLYTAYAFAQSPPLGPPQTDKQNHFIGVGVMVDIVNNQVGTILSQTNDNLAAQHVGARVSALPLQVFQLNRLATQFSDRPNEWYYQLPLTVGIQVHIPDWFDRQVYLPLSLNVSCENWFTGKGTARIETVPGPPSFEGGSWVEDAPGLSLIRDKINSLVRSNFQGPGTFDVFQGPCLTLGAYLVPPPSDKFSAVLWDAPPTGGRNVHTGLELIGPHLNVTFNSLKRLVAHVHGAPWYNPTEQIVLQTYADYTARATQTLTMNEGDSVALNLAPVSYHAPLIDPLVVIANITQQSSNIEDSAFDAWATATNFSPGTHVLQIMKSYVVPPGPGNTKPLKEYIAAYELTYTVNYQSGAVINHPINTAIVK